MLALSLSLSHSHSHFHFHFHPEFFPSRFPHSASTHTSLHATNIHPSSRLTGLFFVTTALYVTQRYLGISVKVVSEEDSTALRKPAHIDNDKDDSPASVYHDSIMFLPTGMPYSLPMKNYVASDPEYPEYKRMMINEAHRQKLRSGYCPSAYSPPC